MTPEYRQALEPFLPYVVVQPYRREGGEIRPRNRLEVAGMPGHLRAKALQLLVPCAGCGISIHCFRQRDSGKPGHLYFAGACPINVNVACSRGAKVSALYKEISALRTSLNHAS